MTKKKTDETTEQERVFTKAQILGSTKYRNRRDALGVVLEDDKTYTCENVDSLLEEFMKGKVN